ncbi:MAG: hypothetical protein KGI98_15640 [Euryarchaeota archaeon]|nr:hypothetical protein [Euryarchaeota archaeon]MDE1879467.1 hypothetical protein [Euryarchaeota archaeon]
MTTKLETVSQAPPVGCWSCSHGIPNQPHVHVVIDPLPFGAVVAPNPNDLSVLSCSRCGLGYDAKTKFDDLKAHVESCLRVSVRPVEDRTEEGGGTEAADRPRAVPRPPPRRAGGRVLGEPNSDGLVKVRVYTTADRVPKLRPVLDAGLGWADLIVKSWESVKKGTALPQVEFAKDADKRSREVLLPAKMVEAVVEAEKNGVNFDRFVLWAVDEAIAGRLPKASTKSVPEAEGKAKAPKTKKGAK